MVVSCYKLDYTVVASRTKSRPYLSESTLGSNDIQVDSRRKSFTRLARNLQIWSGGKRATSMDIGDVFVLQCCQNYLNSSQNKTVWLPTDASRRAGSWAVRKSQSEFEILS